jgi:hypothetical protein
MAALRHAECSGFAFTPRLWSFPMKIVSILAVGWLLCAPAQASPSLAQSRGDEGRAVRLAPVSELPARANRFALVIGVDQYDDPGIARLGGAANDARAIADALETFCGFPPEQVFRLTSDGAERPTRGAILKRLSNLRGVVPRDALLVVAFSGHGIERGGKGYLLAADAQSLNDVALLEDTAVSTDRMRELIKATGVRQVIMLVDACRNDPEAGRGGVDNVMTETFGRAFDFGVRNKEVEAFVTLYASAVGEKAYENRTRGQGYFSEALVEALSGAAANPKGEVTLDALLRYVTEAVAKRTALQFGAAKQQRPFSIVEGYRASDLVVSVADKAAKAKAARPTAAPDQAAWAQIANTTNLKELESFVRTFPNSAYVPLALERARALSSPPATTALPSQSAGTSGRPPAKAVTVHTVAASVHSRIIPGVLGVSGTGWTGASDVKVIVNGKDITSFLYEQKDYMIMLRGKPDELNLIDGKNDIRVVVDGVESDPYILRYALPKR